MKETMNTVTFGSLLRAVTEKIQTDYGTVLSNPEKESISTRTALLCREYMNEDPLVDIERIICLFLEEQVLNRKKYPEKQMDYVYLKFIDAILIEYEMGHKKYDLDILVDRTHISRDQIKDILYRYS